MALGLLSIGTSLTRPPLFGMISNLTPSDEQGATIGVAQGAGSLARIAGPIFATTLLHYMPALPYVLCALILRPHHVCCRPQTLPRRAPGVSQPGVTHAPCSAQKQLRRRIRKPQPLGSEAESSGNLAPAAPRQSPCPRPTPRANQSPVTCLNASNSIPAVILSPNAAVSPALDNGGSCSVDSTARFPFSSWSQ